MQGRDQSIIEHIYNYCKEISEELDQIGNDRTKFLESSVYKNSLALCVLQIGEIVGNSNRGYSEVESFL